MKNLPLAIKFILNVIFFIIYCIVGHLLSGILFAFILTKLGNTVPNAGDPIFIKIGLITTFFILFLTLVFRKIFYISLENNDNKKKFSDDDFFIDNKESKKKEKKERKKVDDDIKIYIEKELNK